MVPSLPLLSCELSVSVKENPNRKKIEYQLEHILIKIDFEKLRISNNQRVMFCKFTT